MTAPTSSSFRGWLLAQAHRDDQVGQLARRVRSEEQWTGRVAITLRDHLRTSVALADERSALLLGWEIARAEHEGGPAGGLRGAPMGAFVLEVGAFQARGDRADQQDALSAVATPTGVLLAVADGMGGHADGRAAAELATSRAARALASQQDRHSARPYELAFKHLDAAVRSHLLGSGGGCALTLAEVHLLRASPEVVFAWAGDVRATLYRPAYGPVFATMPHRPPWRRNVLLRAIGAGATYRPDVSERILVREHDVLMLMSDGVWDELQTAGVLTVLYAARPGAYAIARALVRAALTIPRDEHDNASALVACVRRRV